MICLSDSLISQSFVIARSRRDFLLYYGDYYGG
jgi:hypothetical protein